jgi:tryptophan-rich sensory protein
LTPASKKLATRDSGARDPAWLIFIERSLAKKERRNGMLWTIFVILVVLWLLGMVSSYTLGGFIHILLVLAIGIVLIRIIQGRRPVL